MSYWTEAEEIAERAWGDIMPETDIEPAATPDLEGLSVGEAYLRGKEAGLQQTIEILTKMVQNQIFHSSTARLTGGIGPGSAVYYGVDPEVLGWGAGVTGVVFGLLAFFIVKDDTAGAISVAAGSGGFALAIVSLWRRKDQTRD